VESRNPVGLLLAAVVNITEKHEKATAELRDQARRLLDRHNASVAAVERMHAAAARVRLHVTIDDESMAEAQDILACLS
jgi:hypothetical protein